MKGLKKTFLTLFGYTSNERRSSFILVMLIVVFIVARFIVPDNVVRFDIENILTDTLYVENRNNTVVEYYEKKPLQDRRDYRITELNSCDSAELEALPGLGPVLSGRIIKFRKLLGGFYSVEQLREVYGLNEDIFRIVSGRLKVDTSLIVRIDVNNATYHDLVRLPYLDSKDVNSLLKYREVVGKIGSIGELVENKIVSEETGNIVAHYLDFK
ncbi:MAG TPA: helix-hairpin-helix domain-containing protein [Bacteroidetes bacterium]|jgi:DNA uptake protein ComE-like DNA-binding protein|nr:helix-hairpin-helix domain-containing protein [Bacteroidota bacterium]